MVVEETLTGRTTSLRVLRDRAIVVNSRGSAQSGRNSCDDFADDWTSPLSADEAVRHLGRCEEAFERRPEPIRTFRRGSEGTERQACREAVQ